MLAYASDVGNVRLPDIITFADGPCARLRLWQPILFWTRADCNANRGAGVPSASMSCNRCASIQQAHRDTWFAERCRLS